MLTRSPKAYLEPFFANKSYIFSPSTSTTYLIWLYMISMTSQDWPPVMEKVIPFITE